MTQHNEKGTRRDLVLYRLEVAKSDIKSAKILLDAGECRGANNRAYYGIYHAISAIHALDGNSNRVLFSELCQIVFIRKLHHLPPF